MPARFLSRRQTRPARLFAPVLLAMIGFRVRAASAENPPSLEFFESRIRPLLSEKCYPCHSAASEKLKGGLRLDFRDGLLEGGDSGPAITPGDPEHSLVVKAVRYADPDLQMPPKNKRLSPREIDDLVLWIQTGAFAPRADAVTSPAPASKVPYDYATLRKSWAFRPPEPPGIPAITRP